MKIVLIVVLKRLSKITHLDDLFVRYIGECPWVNLNFVWVMGAVQVPVSF